MEYNKCKQTIHYPDTDLPDLVRDYPLHWLGHDSEVRSGFQKGSLKKATFELEDGHIVIYEKLQS